MKVLYFPKAHAWSGCDRRCGSFNYVRKFGVGGADDGSLYWDWGGWDILLCGKVGMTDGVSLDKGWGGWDILFCGFPGIWFGVWFAAARAAEEGV